MAVIGPVARYLLLAVLLVGAPAFLLWMITATFRTSSTVQGRRVLVGARHALKRRVAQGDLAPEEYERLRLLIRSLPLWRRIQVTVGINNLRLFWIVWCVGWALFWALAGIVQLHWVPAALLAPLSVAAAFLPVGTSKSENAATR
jgi:hypothetical protein